MLIKTTGTISGNPNDAAAKLQTLFPEAFISCMDSTHFTSDKFDTLVEIHDTPHWEMRSIEEAFASLQIYFGRMIILRYNESTVAALYPRPRI